MKVINYTQCYLTKYDMFDIAWIPSDFAVEGKIIKLKENDGSWNDGWTVSKTYGTKTEKDIKDHERDYLLFNYAEDGKPYLFWEK